MRFWLFAALIAFSTFALVSIAASLAVSCLAPAAARWLERYAAASRASWLFRLRMLPAALAAVAAFGVALPVFLAYEPANSGESLARTLVMAGALGAILLVRGTWRAAAAWRATQALRASWQSRGRRIDVPGTALPVFAIDESFPTVAVIGVVRPAFFISERVLHECPGEEIRAMLRHEAAHVTVGDNLRRFLMRACPDALRAGAPLERAWSAAAEEAADAAAVADRPGSAVDLAQALIRVARLAPARPALELGSAFYLGGSIDTRVRRLIAPPSTSEPPSAAFGRAALLAATLCLAALVIATAPLLHETMEALIRHLP